MKRRSAILVFLSVFFLYTAQLISCKSYPAAFEVSDFIQTKENGITYIEESSYFVIKPAASDSENRENGKTDSAVIFYPGGLVEYKAYLPLMEKFAEKGAMCILVKMPFDFAIFDSRAAGRFLKLYPEVENWYMAGHSLGGAMAASYVSRHQADFKGLILLAAYATHDLSDSGLKVLSIYGSNDGVLKMDHYSKYHKNLPPVGQGLTEIIIDDGNHAQVACYGSQKCDKASEISFEEQQEKTAYAFGEWL